MRPPPPRLLSLSGIEPDKHGTFYVTGFDIRYDEVTAAGLPGPVNERVAYKLLITFNTFTKQFGVEVCLGAPCFLPAGFVPRPGKKDYFLPATGSNGTLNVDVQEERGVDRSESWRVASRNEECFLPASVHENENVRDPWVMRIP